MLECTLGVMRLWFYWWLASPVAAVLATVDACWSEADLFLALPECVPCLPFVWIEWAPIAPDDAELLTGKLF